MTRAAVRKFLAGTDGATVKDNAAAEFHKDGDRWIATLSTPEADCDGDRVKGWEWDGETIPLMAAHNHGSLPVGLVRPFIEDAVLKGEVIFPASGTSVASDEARKLVESGVLKAVSIGFMGIGKENELEGIDFDRVKVKEVSLVGVGCCSSAKIEGRVKCACKRANKAPDAVTTAAAVGPQAADHAAAPGALAPVVVQAEKAATIAPPAIVLAPGVTIEQVVEGVRKGLQEYLTKADAEAEKVECPECGKEMEKGGKCPGCGYTSKADVVEETKVHSPKVVKNGDAWDVVDADGKVYGSHDSEEKAKDQLAALHANKAEPAPPRPPLVMWADHFVKCYGEDVVSYYPAPVEARTFAEIMEQQKAQKLAAEADRLQFAFYDSVRSILNSQDVKAVKLLQESLDDYAAAIESLEVEKSVKDKLLQKAGRVFSQANEAAIKEVTAMMDDALAKMRALLARANDSAQPEGEANYPNLLDPARGAKTLVIARAAKADAPAKKETVLVFEKPNQEQERHRKMLRTGRLD